ncbi:MAG TPA: hypothetical protein VFY06_04895 [Verrucomicrobiae bacterium]|nr:hypothetical protein [Verrucomicrobiae bacterium]
MAETNGVTRSAARQMRAFSKTCPLKFNPTRIPLIRPADTFSLTGKDGLRAFTRNDAIDTKMHSICNERPVSMNLVAADVSPLHLKLGKSQSRLTSAATV